MEFFGAAIALTAIVGMLGFLYLRVTNQKIKLVPRDESKGGGAEATKPTSKAGLKK